MKYFIKNSDIPVVVGKPLDFSTKIKQGVCELTTQFHSDLLTSAEFTQLKVLGLIEAREEELRIDFVAILSKKLQMSEKEFVSLFEKLKTVQPLVAYNMVLKELSIEYNKVSPKPINGTCFIISTFDGSIMAIPGDASRYPNLAVFNRYNDAVKAIERLKTLHSKLFLCPKETKKS